MAGGPKMFPYFNNSIVSFKRLSNDDSKLKVQMHQILSWSFAGQDVFAYFPEMAKRLVHPDITIKKMACWFLGRHCADSNEVLLILNSLFGYLRHPNPTLRVLGLQTLVLLPLENQLEFVLKQFMQCLDDCNPLVRRAAVLSCSRIYRDYPISKEECHLLITKLTSMTTDTDVLVSLNVVCILKEMSEFHKRTFVISKPIAIHITSSLENYPSLSKTRAVHLLGSYELKTLEESLDLMNALDGYLKGHACPSTHAAMLSLFLFVVRVHLSHLYDEVIIRFKSIVLNDLNFERKEIVYALLSYLKSLIQESKDLFKEDLQLFLCQRNDEIYIKNEKLDILLFLACSKNQQHVINNVADTFVLEQHQAIQLKAIEVLGKMFRFRSVSSVRTLLDLLSNGNEKLSFAILKELASLNYTSEEKDLEYEVMKVIMNWILKPKMDWGLATDLIIFLGFYSDLYDSQRNLNESVRSNLTLSRNEAMQSELAAEMNEAYIDDVMKWNNEQSDVFEKCSNFPKISNAFDKEQVGGNNDDDNNADDATNNTRSDNNLLDYVIQKLEDVLRSLNIMKHMHDSHGKISYKVPRECLPVLSVLLTTGLKHFVERPTQCQPILTDLFDICSKADFPELTYKCRLYGNMLQDDVTKLSGYFSKVLSTNFYPTSPVVEARQELSSPLSSTSFEFIFRGLCTFFVIMIIMIIRSVCLYASAGFNTLTDLTHLVERCLLSLYFIFNG